METFGNVGNIMETGEGNTSTSPARSRAVPGRYWCFTYFYKNNEQVETLETLFREKNILYFFGFETCPDTKRLHLQGYIDTGKPERKIRPIEYFKIKEISWRKTKGSEEQNRTYCSKDNNVRTNMKIARKVKDRYLELEPKDWQLELDEILKQEPDPRKVYWFWEESGGAGKSTYAKHICMTRNALLISGKGADIKFGLIEHINKHKEIDIVIYDIPRSIEEYVSYTALEEIKNGCFFSGKYESGMCIYNEPHVIVFANFEPKLDKLSKDRWVVKSINRPASNDTVPTGRSTHYIKNGLVFETGLSPYDFDLKVEDSDDESI